MSMDSTLGVVDRVGGCSKTCSEFLATIDFIKRRFRPKFVEQKLELVLHRVFLTFHV